MDSKNLRKFGLKVTQPRVRILDLLQRRRNQHLTADDIYRALAEAGEDIGLGRPDGFAVASDGRFLFARHTKRGAEGVATSGIVLVENWFEEFR